MAEPARKIETDDDWSMSGRRERAVMKEKPIEPEISPDRPFPTGRGVLTKAEIDALLRPDFSDDPVVEEPAAPEPPTQDRSFFDFNMSTAPAAYNPDEEARTIAAAVSFGLRERCVLPAVARVSKISNGPFSDVFSGSRQGSASLFFQNPEGKIAAAMTLSPVISAALIDVACGGKGDPSGLSGRVLTKLDAAVISSTLAPIATSIDHAFTLARTEVDPQFASAMVPPGNAELIDLKITIGNIEAPARLALPHKPEKVDTPARPELSENAVTALLTARIASLSVPVSKLSNLKPGTTLMLGVPADQPVELLSGGRDGVLAAEGDIGRKGNKMAIRVNRRGTYLRKARREAYRFD